VKAVTSRSVVSSTGVSAASYTSSFRSHALAASVLIH